jgi:hypothetical protein
MMLIIKIKIYRNRLKRKLLLNKFKKHKRKLEASMLIKQKMTKIKMDSNILF